MSELLAKQADEVAGVLKQLAHPDRLKVLCALIEGKKSVNELVEYSGAAQSWVSQCLSRMRLEGLVSSEKEGTSVFYEISDPKVLEVMRTLGKIYCQKQGVKS